MLVLADPLALFRLSDQCVAVWQALSVAHARREKIPSRLVLVLPPPDSRQSIVAAQTRGGKGPPMSALGH
jgi:hypothetical protein